MLSFPLKTAAVVPYFKQGKVLDIIANNVYFGFMVHECICNMTLIFTLKVKVIFFLVYCYMLNIHAEFIFLVSSSKCSALVKVPDSLYCGNGEKFQKKFNVVTLIRVCPMLNSSKIFTYTVLYSYAVWP